MKPLAYPVAFDDQDRIVSIEEANRGSRYRCPNCKSEFVIKQGTRRRHFAHKSNTAHCSVESVIHAAAKIDVCHALESAIAKHIKYSAHWNCPVCGRHHSMDLLEGVSSVCLEKQFGDVRPDVSLLDVRGNLVRTVEIVVSHEPEMEALDFCTRNGVQVFAVPLTEEGFGGFRKAVGHEIQAKAVANIPCPTPKCTKCGKPLEELELAVMSDYSCYRCKEPMRVGIWEIGRSMMLFETAPSLPSPLLQLMRDIGLRLEWAYSRAMRYSYWRQKCPRCGALQGDGFISNDLVHRADHEGVEFIRNGLMYCGECGAVVTRYIGPIVRDREL